MPSSYFEQDCWQYDQSGGSFCRQLRKSAIPNIVYVDSDPGTIFGILPVKPVPTQQLATISSGNDHSIQNYFWFSLEWLSCMFLGTRCKTFPAMVASRE